MLQWIISWLLSALVLLALGRTLPGFRIASYGAALFAAVIIALLNATLGIVLKVLTFPVTLLTFGLFLFVVNAIVLKISAALVPGFSIRGFLPAVLAAVLLAGIAMMVRFAIGPGYTWW